MSKPAVSAKRLQTMEKKLRGNSLADVRKVGPVMYPAPNLELIGATPLDDADLVFGPSSAARTGAKRLAA